MAIFPPIALLVMDFSMNDFIENIVVDENPTISRGLGDREELCFAHVCIVSVN
jgi:hypothetical protein